MRRALLSALALIALVVVVVVGLGQARDDSGEPEATGPAFDLEAARRSLAGAPAPLAALHRDANRLLDGGPRAFDSRVRALRGRPVVINKWAAWCGPCQAEFPFFQRQATLRGKQIAFLGIDSRDNREEALTFLRDVPVPFPSYFDPDERIARAYSKAASFPTTVYLDERGETAYIHQGQYRSEGDLADDIDRYLLR